MTEHPPRVQNLEEVIANVFEFNKILQNSDNYTYQVFSQFKDWYYIPSLDLFGPSKFIGYKDTRIDEYNGSGHGGRTNKILSDYFTKLETSGTQYQELRGKLVGFAERVGKKLSAKFEPAGGIYVPIQDRDSNFETTIYPDEIEEKYYEGTIKKVPVNAYERDRKARTECIRHYGCGCSVCGIDFGKTYGARGLGFIHVHHLIPLSSIGERYRLDPIKDLRPVCPNCHAMLHTERPDPLSIDAVKRLMMEARLAKPERG